MGQRSEEKRRLPEEEYEEERLRLGRRLELQAIMETHQMNKCGRRGISSGRSCVQGKGVGLDKHRGWRGSRE